MSFYWKEVMKKYKETERSVHKVGSQIMKNKVHRDFGSYIYLDGSNRDGMVVTSWQN